MTEQELIEFLADKEHDSWSRYMSYFFSKLQKRYVENSGNVANIMFNEHDLIIPAAYVDALQKQIDTPYEMLSEKEKQSDRDEVYRILPIINRYIEEKLDALRKVSLDDIPVGESGEMLILMHNHGKLKPELHFDDDIQEQEPETMTEQETITIDEKFFEHLLNCMCNQKYLPTLAASALASEREKHDQEIIDTAYHQARELWFQNDKQQE